MFASLHTWISGVSPENGRAGDSVEVGVDFKWRTICLIHVTSSPATSHEALVIHSSRLPVGIVACPQMVHCPSSEVDFKTIKKSQGLGWTERKSHSQPLVPFSLSDPSSSVR